MPFDNALAQWPFLWLVYPGMMAGVVVHEAGHAIAGWCVGLPPKAIRIGSGRTRRRMRVGGVTLDLCGLPFTGSVLAYAPQPEQRLAYIMLLLGGVLSNMLLALALVVAAAHWPKVSFVLGTVVFAQAIVIVGSVLI